MDAQEQLPSIAALLVAGLVIGATVPAGAAGANDDGPGPSLLVELDEDGDARLTLVLTYDLTTDDERDAFASLEDDDQARLEARDRFHDRMAAVADDAATETDREMSIDGASVDLRRTDDGETGIVALQVTWRGLAAVENDRVIVTEPFASGYTADRPVRFVGPDGYEVTSAAPGPDETDAESTTWTASTDFDGFELVYERSDAEPVGLPGFGVVTAIFALLAVGVWARR